MPRVTLIVLERTGEWAVAIRRHLDELAMRLLETRSFDEFWLRMAEHPTALAAWEMTELNVRLVTAALVRLQREFPRASAVILAEAPIGCLRAACSRGGGDPLHRFIQIAGGVGRDRPSSSQPVAGGARQTATACWRKRRGIGRDLDQSSLVRYALNLEILRSIQ